MEPSEAQEKASATASPVAAKEPVEPEEVPEPIVKSALAEQPAAAHSVQPRKISAAAGPPPTLENEWGIEISSMRLTMGNSAVDMRYRVIDPEKAAKLGDGKTVAYIVDRDTGRKLIMPTPPKEGAFPPTSNKLIAGRTYASIVSNQGGTLKSGSQVTVLVGKSEVANLTVE